MLTDLELIKNYKLGQKDSFALLYDRYVEKIYKFVYYKTGHKETAEDLVSSVFIKAVKKLNDFKENGGSFQAWLYQIARNTVIDHYRAIHNDVSIDDIWDLPSGSDTSSDTDIKIKLEKIEKYLSVLKSEQRDILIMRIWQEMSYKEISLILGKSEASCKMSFSRTIKQLRESMPMDTFVYLLLIGALTV